MAVDSLALVRPRSVGAEHVALWALAQLGLPALLESLGVNAALRDAALGSVVARMAFPASERATHRWLRERSAVGELLGVDFETVGAMQLYRASDALMAHREAIEAHLFDAAMELFDTRPTVTLFDLTNTCLEGRRGGSAEGQARPLQGEAQRLSAADPWAWCWTRAAPCAVRRCSPAASANTRPWRPCCRRSGRRAGRWW